MHITFLYTTIGAAFDLFPFRISVYIRPSISSERYLLIIDGAARRPGLSGHLRFLSLSITRACGHSAPLLLSFLFHFFRAITLTFIFLKRDHLIVPQKFYLVLVYLTTPLEGME